MTGTQAANRARSIHTRSQVRLQIKKGRIQQQGTCECRVRIKGRQVAECEKGRRWGKGAAREKYWESEASEELKGWGKLKSRNIFLCPFLPAECQSHIFLCPSLPAECQSWRRFPRSAGRNPCWLHLAEGQLAEAATVDSIEQIQNLSP